MLDAGSDGDHAEANDLRRDGLERAAASELASTLGSSMAGLVTRKVVFARTRDVAADEPFDRCLTAAAAHALGREAWVVRGDDMVVGVIVEGVGSENEPTLLRLVRLRDNDDRPYAMNLDRATVPIALLEDQSLAEWAHVVLWPDGLVAHDPHRDAPGLNRLSSWFRDRCGAWVTFDSLYDRTLIERLRALRHVRMVSVKISTADAVQRADDQRLGLFGGLFASARETESATIAQELSVGRERRRALNPDFREEVAILATEATGALESLIIRGIDADGTVVTLDMLKERVQVAREVPRDNPVVRAPEQGAMFEAMLDARRELDDKGIIAQAAVGSVR